MRSKTSSRRRAYGQHFLTNPSITDKIVRLADVTEQDSVLEIGPGRGILTESLLKTGCRVIAVEKDTSLARALQEKYQGDERVEIVADDFLRVDLKSPSIPLSLKGEVTVADPPLCQRGARGDFLNDRTRAKVVANLPYSVATEIIFKLIDHRHLFSSLHVMVQKEVAERLAAKPGGKSNGVLSILTQLYSDSQIVMKLPPGAFSPPPKVDSAVVQMKLSQEPRVSIQDESAFKKLVRQAFATRRKMLKNALQLKDDQRWREICEEIGIDPKVRAEEFGLSQFSKLANTLQNIKK